MNNAVLVMYEVINASEYTIDLELPLERASYPNVKQIACHRSFHLFLIISKQQQQSILPSSKSGWNVGIDHASFTSLAPAQA